MMNLGALVLPHLSRNLTVYAPRGGAYVRGKWVDYSPKTTVIRANVQPTSGKQLQDLPEGLRADAKYTVWSTSELQVNDEIDFAGERWRVLFVWPRGFDGGFYRAVMGLMK